MVDLVLDRFSFQCWDNLLGEPEDPLGFTDTRPYPERVKAARAATGLDEAAFTGVGTVARHPLALIALDFAFLGGSMGLAVGQRVSEAFERARRTQLPLLALVASGGVRMQEGTLALAQMARTAGAVRRFVDAGLPYVAYLGHPTTGGVLASWASLATVTLAQPGALIGFAGPRVASALAPGSVGAGVQRAEHLRERGLVDEVVAPEDLRERIATLLRLFVTARARVGPPAVQAPRAPTPPRDAWDVVCTARDPRRPGAREIVAELFDVCVELRGDGTGQDPGDCFAAIASFEGQGVVVLAQIRVDGRAAEFGPAGYRKARRAMLVAEQLTLPLVTFVDTPGAELSSAAEQGGLAREIAACLAQLSGLRTPTVAVLLGEGGSGGALALAVADRVIAAANATLAVISPEGASAILYHDTDHPAELARSQAITATELSRWGLVDRIVAEPPSAAEDPAAFGEQLRGALATELASISGADPNGLLGKRMHRFERLHLVTTAGDT